MISDHTRQLVEMEKLDDVGFEEGLGMSSMNKISIVE